MEGRKTLVEVCLESLTGSGRLGEVGCSLVATFVEIEKGVVSQLDPER